MAAQVVRVLLRAPRVSKYCRLTTLEYIQSKRSTSSTHFLEWIVMLSLAVVKQTVNPQLHKARDLQ